MSSVRSLRQAALLNTNSRYPHPERVRYIERLAALFPDPLDTVFLVCTGSEANDLASPYRQDRHLPPRYRRTRRRLPRAHV